MRLSNNRSRRRHNLQHWMVVPAVNCYSLTWYHFIFSWLLSLLCLWKIIFFKESISYFDFLEVIVSSVGIFNKWRLINTLVFTFILHNLTQCNLMAVFTRQLKRCHRVSHNWTILVFLPPAEELLSLAVGCREILVCMLHMFLR